MKPYPRIAPRPAACTASGIALAAALAGLSVLVGCSGGGSGGSSAAASLTAANLAVLYDQNNATSVAMARAYQSARGVPEANMIGLTVPAGDAIGPAAFETLKQSVEARLPDSVQATLVAWSQPSRVVGACAMGITSALALGYDTRWCGGCAATAASPYYNSSSRAPWTDLRLRPSMMLGTSTLADAQALIARGVAADGRLASGSPIAQAWLVRTTDEARSVRYGDFRVLASIPVPGVRVNYVDNAAGLGSDIVTGQRDVLFYLTGLVSVAQAASNQWLPGAAADHLTSTGGLLPGGGGQKPITAWLAAGATGSYGTVEEPCNVLEKFPRASVLVARYGAGDTLIEAYWKSVQAPGQGLFVGEPLARPFARR